MKTHDEATLPKWARERLEQLRFEAAELKRQLQAQSEAHLVLTGREWFPINGPPPDAPARRLWSLANDAPFSVCSLGPGDVLLIGRARKDGT